jgi:hypothetical protein
VRALWIQVHLSFGLLGWVGCLITSVSWQVLPMFYLCPSFTRRITRAELLGIASGLVIPLAIVTMDGIGMDASALPGSPLSFSRLAALGALPAVFVVWIFHPIVTLRLLERRRRRQVDASLRFWQSGLLVAPCIGIAAIAAHLTPDPRWGVLFGWLAVWGWAGMIIHGMLTRIVPFLVWFHRFSPVVGRLRVPSIRTLLPDAWTKLGLALHLLSLAAGVVAIWTSNDWAARLCGILLIATAIQLEHSLIHVLRHRAEGLPRKRRVRAGA